MVRLSDKNAPGDKSRANETRQERLLWLPLPFTEN